MKNSRTIIYLLHKQPASLQKLDEYKSLVNSIRKSLLNKVLPYKAYILLNNCQVKSVSAFLIYYKLPLESFFPNFLTLKKRYINEQKAKKLQKQKDIQETLKLIPKSIKEYLRYYMLYEKKISGNKVVIFYKIFVPSSKSKANTFIKFTTYQWCLQVEIFINSLSNKYIRTDHDKLKFINYKMFMGYSLEEKITTLNLKEKYRKNALLYHPDQGGNDLHFNYLLNADNYLSNQELYKN